MIRGVFSSLGIATVSLSGLLMLGDSAAAQRREGGEAKREGGEARREGREIQREGRYEGGRNYDGGYFGDRGGYFGDRGSWGYNRGYWGGYGPYGGWGYGRGFNRPYWGGYSYGRGYYGYGDRYSTYSDDGYYDGGRQRLFGRRGGRRGGSYYGNYYSGGCSGYYGSGCSGYGSTIVMGDSAIAGATASSDRALITVKVAPDAEIAFDDFKTTQTGSDRQFITPALEPNRDFTYTVHVRSNGQEKTEKITVHAGGQVNLDLTKAAGSGERAAEGESIKAPRKGEKYGLEPRTKDQGTERRQSQEARSEDKDRTKTHEGQVVRVSGQELVMKDASGKEHSHTLAKDAKVIIDGKPAKAEDLKPNMKIEVTTAEADMKTALRVEATSSK